MLDVNPDTLRLGESSGVEHRNGPHPVDMDGDGYLDLLLHHRVVDAVIGASDSEACLSGETWDGTPLEGCDVVTPVGAR